MTRRPSARTRRTVDQALVDTGKCGRPTRGAEAKGPHCTRPAGWGTDHVGSGACKLHGGNKPIKHGRFSEVARERLGERYDRWRADPELASIDGEIAILRGLMERQIEGEGSPDDVADMAERVVRAVDILLKHREKFGITMETLNRVTQEMGVGVAKYVKDPAVLESITEYWRGIKLIP